MSVQVEKLEKNMAKITLETEVEKFEEAIEKAYQKQRGQISIPGFRKGKVPRKMIEKMYGEEIFFEEAANILIPEVYEKMLEENEELEIVSQPKIEVVQIEKGKPFIFTAEVAVKPEVTLGLYKGIEVAKQDDSVSEEDVDAALESERNKNGRTVEVTDRNVEDGDIVNLDFDGYVDGEQFDGGKYEGYSLTIGSGSFIPGFEDQLIGMAIGEDKDVNVTFPEDYHATDLAGKEAVFKCKINSISKKELPELDDDFASDVSDFETLAEYREDLKANLEKTRAENARTRKENEAIEQVIANSEMEIPDPMIDLQVSQMFDDMARNLSMQGLSMEQYLQFTSSTREDVEENLRPDALRRIQTRLVLEAVAAAENIEVTDERVDEEIAKMAEMYQMDVDKMKELVDERQRDIMKKDIAVQDAVTLIADAAVEVEKEEEKAEEASEEAAE